MTEHARMGLMDNILSMVLAHPIQQLAAEAVGQMLKDLHSATGVSKRLIRFDIFTPENA